MLGAGVAFPKEQQQQQAFTLTPSLRLLPNGIEFQQLWSQTRVGCEAILNWPLAKALRGAAMRQHLVDMYTLVYRLASNPGRNVPGLVKGGSETVSGKDDQSTQVLVLYYLLREMLKAHLDNRVKPNFSGKNGLELLKVYNDQWRQYTVGLELLSFTFRYLHNHWNKQGLPVGHVTTSTKPLGLMLWGDIIVNSLRGPLEVELIAAIRNDREHGIVDAQTTALVRTVLGTFTPLANHDSRRQLLFADVFENPYIRDTMSYYQNASLQSLQGGSVQKYISDALQWTADEMRRVERYTTEKSTIPASIRKTLLAVFVDSRTTEIFAPVESLLVQNDEESTARLGNMFRLIKASEPSVLLLADKLKARVTEDGLKSIATLAPRDVNGAEFVQVVFDVYRRYKKLIETQFDSHPSLFMALCQGSKAFVNRNPHHNSDAGSEHLARYAGNLLRPSQTRDEDVEKNIKELVEVFDLFEERDVFQSSYSTLLCQRLIQGNIREEWEEQSIKAFCAGYGRDFTYKWERMLVDATVTRRELKEAYQQDCLTAPPPVGSCELHPLILTAAWWPLKMESSVFSSTSAIGMLQRHFESFYQRTMGGRTLKWLLQFSTGIVEARITPAAHAHTVLSFTVSAPQWELLHLLNRSDHVSFQQLKAATQLTDTAALQRAVFAFLKLKVLQLVDPSQRDVEQQTYSINAAFTPTARKINFVALAQGAETSQQRTAALGSAAGVPEGESGATATPSTQVVHNERRFAVQAAIVRVMKSRRTATYAELLNEVEDILKKNKFLVSPADLKVNLEVLIEKEYVERSPTDPNVFVYLS